MSKEPDKTAPDQLERLLPEALAAANPADDQHFDLDELSRLANARREGGGSWEMPQHLSRCSLCLESFQIILEGLSAPSATTLKRFVQIRERPSTDKVLPFPVRTRFLLKIAAVVALILGGLLFLHLTNRTTSARVNEGAVALENGSILSSGAAIPGGATVTAREPTRTTLGDGSAVDINKDARVSFHESLGGDTTVALTAGGIIASVTKQANGNEFIVKTPLGVVVVVGTRFRVICEGEDVIVYQSTPGRSETTARKDVVRAVRVTVFEGIVRVKKQSEQVDVRPNQTAVLRENEPGIEVSGEKR